MIEVNLLPGKKKKAAGAGFRLALPDFRGLVSQVKDPWLLGAVAATVVLGGGSAALFVFETARVKVLESDLAAARVEKRRFDAYIAELRRAERLRDSLVAEVRMIRSIDGDRYIWPHMLDQISKALPPYTWLVDVSSASTQTVPGQAPPGAVADAGETLVRVSITGRTVDIQAYTTFLRQLANSPWLTDVTPAQSLTRIESDRPVTEFNLTARYRVADSLYIRTVPLAQSLR